MHLKNVILIMAALCSPRLLLSAQGPEKWSSGTLTLVKQFPLPDDIPWVSRAAFGPRGVLAISVGKGAPMLFDSLLQNHTTIGRLGEGPGEFRDIFAMFWTGDTLTFADPSLSRLTFYRSGKTLAGTISLGQILPSRSIPSGRTATGGWIVESHSLAGGPVERTIDTITVLHYQGASPRVLLREFGPIPVARIILAPGAFRMFPHPFVSTRFYKFSSQMQAVVSIQSVGELSSGAAELSIVTISPAGDTLQRRRIAFSRKARSAKVQAAFLDSVIQVTEKSPGSHPPDLRRVVTNALGTADFFPMLKWSEVDRSGEVWFRAEVNGQSNGLLCRTSTKPGSAIPCAAIPAGLQPLAADIGGRVIFTKMDDDGVVSLLEYRLK